MHVFGKQPEVLYHGALIRYVAGLMHKLRTKVGDGRYPPITHRILACTANSVRAHADRRC